MPIFPFFFGGIWTVLLSANPSWPQLEGYLPRFEFRSCAFKRWISAKKGFPEWGPWHWKKAFLASVACQAQSKLSHLKQPLRCKRMWHLFQPKRILCLVELEIWWEWIPDASVEIKFMEMHSLKKASHLSGCELLALLWGLRIRCHLLLLKNLLPLR